MIAPYDWETVARDQDANDRTMVERVDPLLGAVLDRRFKIDFRLAAGGFGAIYCATHVKSGHQVALKVLHPQLAVDPGVVARFRREGATLTTLRNPHTITAYELGEADDGTLYIVMELLRGESLFERFRAHGRFEWKRLVRIARQVCDSLAEAHRLGIVHRDLKPTNIHLEDYDGDPDFVKVLDFGIAKILHDSDFDSSDLTNAGQMIGTLDYMAPEQMVGGVLTGQCDIYTLGIVMYEMIAGVRPFAEANSPVAALAAILKTDPPPLSTRVPVPVALDRVISKCLDREPKRRFARVEDLAAALDSLVGDTDSEEVTHTVDAGGLSTTTPMAAVPETTMVGGPPKPSPPRVGGTPAPVRTLAPSPHVRPRNPSTAPSAQRTPTPAVVPRANEPADMERTLAFEPDPVRATSPTGAPPPGARTKTPTGRTPPPTGASADSGRGKPPTTPPIVPPAPTPLEDLSSASPFKTTLPGAQLPPNAGVRASQPVMTIGPHGPVAGGAALPDAAAAGLSPPVAHAALPPGFPPATPPGVAPLGFPPATPPGIAPLGFPPPEHASASPHAPIPPTPGLQPRPSFPPTPFPPSASLQRLPAAPIPPTPSPSALPAPAPGFDMAKLAARDAAVRRIVWIVVLATAAIVGVIAATQL